MKKKLMKDRNSIIAFEYFQNLYVLLVSVSVREFSQILKKIAENIQNKSNFFIVIYKTK